MAKMRMRVALAGVVAGVLCSALGEREASAQIQPVVERDENWSTVSTVSMMIGVASASLMPRIYYSSPDATVGWKARWHISALAPIMSMTAATLLVEYPIRDAIQNPKVDCSVDDTLALIPENGCFHFGGPSTHAFASWGAFGYGTTVFLVDTIKYSDWEFHAGALVGDVVVPLGAAIVTSVARSADGSGVGPESVGQVVAGALPGAVVGALLGLGYSFLQEPDCGYGGFVFCW
jgi:hypothetical protein